MPSIFTKIVQGEIPCHKIAEDDRFLAFLDIAPNTPGHTLCIPKKEVDRLLDLDEETYMGLMAFSRKVGMALEAAVACDRVGMSVIGLEVPHVHVHLIPLSDLKDASFQHKATMDQEALQAIARRIRAKL